LCFLATFVNFRIGRPLEDPIDSTFGILAVMPGRKQKAVERPVFDSIRKPTAPPSRKFGEQKPEEKARPSRRKAKHKKQIDSQE
jgi:hypothetical protein